MSRKALRKILKTTLSGLLFLCIIATGGQVLAEDTYTTYKMVKQQDVVIAEGYDYSLPVPKNLSKDLGYFNDAVFLGDSRTVDLMIYSKLKNTKAFAYCDVGLNVNTVFQKKFITVKKKKVTALEALKANKKKYSKIYLMFGINELGFDSVEGFIKAYKKLIDNLRKIKPEAVIYVQSVLPVAKSKDQTSALFTNRRAKKFNTYIKEMCAEKKVFFIDAYAAFEGADGYLPEAIASDGIHFREDVCDNWLSYLANHTLEYTPKKKEKK